MTVLSTCLGLLTIGMPPQVHASAGQSLNVAGSAGQDGGAPCDPTRLEEIARDKFAAIDINSNWLSHFIEHLDNWTDDDDNLKGRFEIAITAERLKDGGLRLASNIVSSQMTGDGSNSRIPDLAEQTYWLVDNYTRGINGAGKAQPSPVRFELRLDDTEFYAGVSFNQGSVVRAHKYADAFNQHLAYELCLRDGNTVDLEYLLYRNARAVARGRQVQIVTRLPRASIDALKESQSPAN